MLANGIALSAEECKAAVMASAHSSMFLTLAEMISSLSSTERRCQKCGIATKGEEALVNGQIWCHPCADAAPADEVMRLRTRLLDAESALSVWEPERSAIYWNKYPTRLKDQL